MQSSKQNQNPKAVIKQSMQSMQKTIVPFNQQLLNLQKKIQEVQTKNELILQKIHKAYDFKKSKNKVFYDASQDEGDQHQGMIVNSNVNVVQQRVGGSINYRRNQLYPNIDVQYGQMQPKQFQVNSARKELTRPPVPPLQLSNRYQMQLNQLQNINPIQHSSSSPSSGNDLTQDMHEQPESQQASSRQHHQLDESRNEYQQPRNDYEQQSSEQDQDFKSHSNYSDIEKRKRITENFRRREKDFSDIKSSFQDRRNIMDQQRQDRRVNRHTPKKSYVFSSVENNSSYSEGNLPNKEHDMQADDLEMIESPITTNPTYFNKIRSPHHQSPQNYQTYSSNQIYGAQSYVVPQSVVMASVPNIPHQSMQMMGHSVPSRSPPYQHAMSQVEVNYLSDMYKAQRQKSLALQKQVQQKQESIQHLKMYKKSFRRFRDHTFHLFEQAFDQVIFCDILQYVETFLRNRLYKIEKAMRKNQNKLSSLLMQVKDFKEQRVFNNNLKRNLTQKLNRRSHSSTQQSQKPNMFQQRGQQEAFQQNYSSISSRSRQRSISARKRKSQDKSVTKKSNQSQHLMMKKEFTNIAENYQTMIKVKNEEIEKYQAEVKQIKSTIQVLEEENNRLKIVCQQQLSQLQTVQLQNQLAGSSVESQQPKRNSGNLRILSRNSSKSDIKKNTNTNALAQENQQLLQKIKNLQHDLEGLAFQNSSLQEQLDNIHHQHLTSQGEMKLMAERIFQYEQKALPLKEEKILSLESTINKLTKDYQNLNDRNIELNNEMQTMKIKLTQKDKKILQLDSALYLKNSEIKKVQNLLTLKTYKLQEFNKLLLTPSSSQPLNDSISSIIQQPHNKTTFLMLQNLQKQLEQEKQQKEVEFLKLKRSYQAKIQQLKIEFEEIVLENQRLSEKLSTQNLKEIQWSQEKQQLTESNQQLKQEVERLQKEVAFLTEKVNFYQAQRHTGRTGSFGGPRRKDKQGQHPSQTHLNYMKPHAFEQQDFDDFPSIEDGDLKRKEKSSASWKPVSGQIQLLDESSYYASFNGKKSPSQQNRFELKRTGSININQNNAQQKLSEIKDENIELSQKVAKFQKENKFLKQTEIEQSKKYQDLKNQLAKFTEKYEDLQKNNQQLIKMIEDLQKEKNELLLNIREHNVLQPMDWKQIEKNIEPVELKGSGMYSPWSFAEKDDILIQKSGKQFDIRDSIVSNFHINRPSRESRESHDKKLDQLTKKLSQTQLLLQNKQKINQQLVIGFTKKIDKLNTQLQEHAKQQGKVIEKYIQQNSKLRKDKEKLQEQISALKSQASRQQSIKPQQENKLQNQQNLILQEEEQINFDENNQEQEGQFGMLEQRIQGFNGKGFMLGINQDDQQEQKQQTPSKQKVRFGAVVYEDQEIDFQDFEEKSQKIQLLQKQVKDLQQTIEKLQKFLEDSLNKVKQKEQEKFSLVQQLQRKNNQVQELRDLIQLKQIGKSHTLTLSKSINYGRPQRSSIDKSQRPRMNSITSLKYSRTNQGDRKQSFDEQINFDFLDQSNNPNKSINLQHSQVSGMYSENMSMIFDKEENFLDHVRKAKNKRKEQGKLLRKTFEYIKKLRANLNEKNKKIKILQMRIQQLKDNCWLWKKNNQPQGNNSGIQQGYNSGIQQGSNQQQSLANNPSGIHSMTEPHQHQNDHSYQDHNQSLSEENNNRLVDSRLFECNSQDLNKKKPHRHNHYKKLQYDTKLIVQQNKILTKQIEMLQQQLIKIEEQENGLMAVKQLYKQQIRALNKQNQQLSTMHQVQVQKMQQKLQCSQGVHNFQAIKQLFKKIIDNVGVILYPSTSQQAKKKTHNQLKEEKRKQAEECIKVICSILNYQENIRNQLCLRLCGQQPS